MNDSDYIANPYTTKPAPRGSIDPSRYRDPYPSFGLSDTKRAEDRVRIKAAAEQAQGAVAEWQALRAKFTATPQGAILRDLLDVHQPELYSSYRGPVCGYCDQIGGPERDGVDWPCVNYEIIRDGMG